MLNNRELIKLYDECNKKYFNNELNRSGVRVEWSNRMTTVAGTHHWQMIDGKMVTTRIALSRPYHERETDDIRNTLVHEMIHQKYPANGHGEKFQKEMERLNQFPELNIEQYSRGRAVVNYVYGCNECTNEWERSNRMDTSRYRCECGGIIELKYNFK